MSKKQIWWGVGIVVVIAIVVIATMSSSHSAGTTGTKPTITIGVTLPLTGDIAMLGQSNKNAIEMAYQNLNATNLKYNYKLGFEDDQFKPSVGATTANKLISVDGANALISFGSPVGNVVSPIAEANKVPHINDFASDPHVATGQYNFVDYTPSYEDGKLMVQELEKRGLSKVVFFEQGDNSGAAAIISAFENAVKGTDINVLSTQAVLTGSTDFRTQIDKVKNLGADIYVLEVTTPELEILTKQIRNAGINTPLTNMESFEFSSQLSLFEGMWYVNDADPMQWFVDMYTKEYGQAPKFGAANGYDSFNMLVQAFETAGDGKTVPSGTQVADAITNIKGFNGALGNDLNMGSDHLVDSKSVVRMIKNGVPETIAP
jgi:branched-chain amino acid transport system substrate-binding protein